MHFIYQNTYFHPALTETIAVSLMHALGFVGNYKILPETNNIQLPRIIPLFGILCPPTKKEECHFCLEKITKGQFLVFKLPCCEHYTHTECFKTWALLSHTESTVRCTYCRTTYQNEDTCFLCLQEYTKKLVQCAPTQTFTQTSQLYSHSYDHLLECGKLAGCNRSLGRCIIKTIL